MWETIKIFGGLIVLMLLLELMDLPDWIGNKLRGKVPNKDIQKEIKSLEARIKQLEDKTNN